MLLSLSLCTHSVSVHFSLCFLALLPLCVLNNFYAEATNYKHSIRGSQTQRITFNTSTHYTLHIYTPVCFALFCFVLLCFPVKVCVSSVRDLSHPAKNMSHKTEHVGHWEDLETWLGIVTGSLLPKAAEILQHQTQDQLDDNITSLMRKDPSQSYSHKELAKITGSLSHTSTLHNASKS